MDGNSNWKRDILLIPLAVGVVLAAAAYFLPKLFEKGKRISYTIDGSTAYVNPNVVGTVKITVGGVETPNIYAYKVRLWNSGSVPLTALPVRFAFGTTATNFKIFNVTHETIPKKEFGKIEESGSDAFSKRFVYELLNREDEDIVTFLTSLDAPLSVFAKAEGLLTNLVEAKAQGNKWTDWLSAAVLAMTLIYIFVITILQRLMVRKISSSSSSHEHQ